MQEKILSKFNPLLFLISLGAGGLAVTAFIFIQYGGIFTGQGLATFAQVSQTPLVLFLETVMIVLGLVHLLVSIQLFDLYRKWKKIDIYQSFKNNPLVNSALMAPILSLAMSFNVMIAVVRYFVPVFSDNFQFLIAPAFMAYSLLWLWAIVVAVSLLKTSFVKSFDVDKIHFGWLLQPFTLAMVTVTGTGFSALAKNTETIYYNSDIAALASFLAVISGSMAVFLFLVKLFALFKKHLSRDSVLENTFVPTYLIVIPIITLFGISAFRLGHYTEHIFHQPILFTLAKMLVFGFFAFQVWYFAFALVMMKEYWRNYFTKNYHVSQWGLICPFVAFTALGLLFFKIFLTSTIFMLPFFWFMFAVFLFTVGLFFFLFTRQYKCLYGKVTEYDCVT